MMGAAATAAAATCGAPEAVLLHAHASTPGYGGAATHAFLCST